MNILSLEDISKNYGLKPLFAGATLGLDEPWKFFWATGLLSSFLDNAPTYVIFFETAKAIPADPSAMDDHGWGEFLYARTNPKGDHAERWRHTHGCGRFFNAVRNTYTDKFVATYAAGSPRPGGCGACPGRK